MNNRLLLLGEKVGYETLSAKLAPYLTAARKEKIEMLLPKRLNSIHLAVEAPSDPHNAAAVVRSCEALGVMNAHVIEAEGRALHAKRTTQGAFHWIHTHHHNAFEQFLQQLKHRQSTIVLAGATMDGDQPLSQLPLEQPLCLLFGNENRGLSPQARQACDLIYHIPMFGMSESLNLSVSAAISLYDVTTRKRQQLQQSGDLTADEIAQLRLHYYANSLEKRLVTQLLNSD
ncbi:MAG: RNA methyltransferase [Gammaproteobacteria bacterium]|nr:RNA methyltransferase [Gammaproteobacteria bacterium]